MNPIVTFEMADGKSFKAELYPEKAPTRSIIFYRSSKKDFMTDLFFTASLPVS